MWYYKKKTTLFPLLLFFSFLFFFFFFFFFFRGGGGVCIGFTGSKKDLNKVIKITFQRGIIIISSIYLISHPLPSAEFER